MRLTGAWWWCISIRLAWLGGAMASMLILGGCASPIIFHVPRANAEQSCYAPLPDREVLVGVALSGDGSRAALFGAAGLEALGRIQTSEGRSALEQITYMSSVSGGSMASMVAENRQ